MNPVFQCSTVDDLTCFRLVLVHNDARTESSESRRLATRACGECLIVIFMDGEDFSLSFLNVCTVVIRYCFCLYAACFACFGIPISSGQFCSYYTILSPSTFSCSHFAVAR